MTDFNSDHFLGLTLMQFLVVRKGGSGLMRDMQTLILLMAV